MYDVSELEGVSEKDYPYAIIMITDAKGKIIFKDCIRTMHAREWVEEAWKTTIAKLGDVSHIDMHAFPIKILPHQAMFEAERFISMFIHNYTCGMYR